MSRLLSAFVFVSVVLVASAARANCPTHFIFDGPLQLELFEGDQAVAPSACPHTEVSVAAAASAILDTPHYYGTFEGGTVFRGSYSPNGAIGLYGTIDALQVRYIQEATLKTTAVNLGQTSIGAMAYMWGNAKWDVSQTFRVVWPTSSAYVNAHPFAVDIMIVGRYQPIPKLAFHGEVGFTTSAAASLGPSDPAYGATFLLAGEWAPVRWFSLEIQTSTVLGYMRPVYQYVVGGGFRFRMTTHTGLELDGLVPVVGQTGTRFSGGLRFIYGW